jgi:hypothetical protein
VRPLLVSNCNRNLSFFFVGKLRENHSGAKCVLISVYAGVLIGVQPRSEALKPGLPARAICKFPISETCPNAVELPQ